MLLIFDCDGVVLDSMPLHTEVESEVYKKYGIDIAPAELGRRFSGVPLVEEFKILSKETGIHIPPEVELEMGGLKKEVFARRLKTMPGIEDALERLNGIPRCIASGMRMEELAHSLGIVNLHLLFAPHIFSSEMVAKGKPSPDLFLFAAEQLEQSPAECVVIEDGIAGVQAARAAGMLAFGFVGGSHCDSDLSDRLMGEGAQLVFSDMRELPALVSELG
jgi:HAD superfamily hydrolase (TIGR01509 family)